MTNQQISTAPIIDALDNLFHRFNQKFYESALSKPVITISQKGTRKAAGWCTREKIWQDGNGERHFEINICPEYLNRPIEEICETMLHEMVHLSNALNGIQDYSRTSQYHNAEFKARAEKHGLTVEKHPSRGFAETSLKIKTREYIKTIDLTAFDLFRDSKSVGNPQNENDKKPSSTRKYACPVCGTSIRATKNVNVTCGDCGVGFELQP